MSEQLIFSEIHDKQYAKHMLENYGISYCLTEQDFYPPTDNRVLQSYVEDVDGGDNFTEYCKYIFDLLTEEGYYD